MKNLKKATTAMALTGILVMSGLEAPAMAGAAAAAPGDLDPSFGRDGKVRVDFARRIDEGRDMAIQSDGKIILAGEETHGPVVDDPDRDFAAVRLNADGSLDTTFGSDGRVSTHLGKNFELAFRMDLQRDGKLVAAGWSCDSTREVIDFSTCDIALVRYNTDGTPDTTFSGDGRLTTDFGNDDEALDVVAQRDGKILVVGVTVRPDEPDRAHAFVLRYNADGSLDTTFGTGGKVISDQPLDDSYSGVAIQGDGKIVAAGAVTLSEVESHFLVTRYTSNGRLDRTFSGDGMVTTNFDGAGADGPSAVTVQPDGKILVAGGASLAEGEGEDPATGDFGLARYNSDGTPDSYFGAGGKVTTDFKNQDEGYGLALQPDGRIVVVGVSDLIVPEQGDFAVARYNTNGALDTRFSADGKIITDFLNSFDRAFGVGVQTDGKIVVGGEAGVLFGDPTTPRDRDFGIVRYQG